MDSTCYHCSDISTSHCPSCSKALCSFCIETDHCELSCDRCSGRGSLRLGTLFDSVCLSCIGSKTGYERLTVLWKVTGDFDPTEIFKLLLSSFCQELELKFISPVGAYMPQIPVCMEVLVGSLEEHITGFLRVPVNSPVLVVSKKFLEPDVLGRIIESVRKSSRELLLADESLGEMSLLLCKRIQWGEDPTSQVLEHFAVDQIMILNKGDLVANELERKGVAEPLETIQNSISSGYVKEVKFRYAAGLKEIRFLSLIYRKVDEKTLRIVIACLENRSITPFISRVMDMLVNDLGIITSENKVIRAYNGMLVPSLYLALPKTNGQIEQVLVLKAKSAITKKYISKRARYLSFLKMMTYEPLPTEIGGLYTMALFYKFSTRTVPKSSSIKEIYH